MPLQRKEGTTMTRSRKNRVLALGAMALLSVTLLSGCAGHDNRPTVMPPVTPTQVYTEPEEQYANQGSLFNAAEADNLYADNRAHRIGDIVLVNVVENAKSKSKADTSTTKTAGSEYGVSAAFRSGSAGLFGPTSGGLSGKVGVDPILSTTTTSGLSATGETKRENYVTATIGARVMQVLPGGVLQVQGAREVRVNEETQYMVVSGLVRSSDIGMDNSVLSTQMADSKIEYYGKGVLADKQKAGWLTRLMDNIWPF